MHHVYMVVQAVVQARGVATGGISVYIPPKSVYLTNLYVVTGCFFLFDPGQIVVDFEIGMTS